jgi:hypothetical protein
MFITKVCVTFGASDETQDLAILVTNIVGFPIMNHGVGVFADNNVSCARMGCISRWRYPQGMYLLVSRRKISLLFSDGLSLFKTF